MTPQQPRKRRLVRGLLWLSAGGILFLAVLPVWFPWGLTLVAGHYGLVFADYERLGWTRFAATGVHGAWGGTRLEVQRAESVLPTTWLWRRFNERTNDPPLLSLCAGQLMFAGAETNAVVSANTERRGSAGETLNQISQIGRTLQKWLPMAALTNCAIQVASNLVTISQAEWRAGRLHGIVRIPSSRGEVELAVQMDGDSAMKFAANWSAYDASLRGEFSQTSQGWRWNGELGWLTNHAEFAAQFTTNAWWPTQAQVDCRNWQIPVGFLKVEGYENLVANVTANVVSNQFDLQATGFAQPSAASARSGWPAVNFSLGANGDPTGVKLRTLNIQSPWLNADLTNTVGISWRGELLAEPAQLCVSVDLDKLPGAMLTGEAEGVVQIEPQSGRPPVAQFLLSAAHLRSGGLEVKKVRVRGEFAAPILKLNELRADFADESALVADGNYDGAAGRLLAGHWQWSGGLLQKYLPGLSYAELVASGEIAGPFTNLTHSGKITFTKMRVAGLKPLDVRANWSGQNHHLGAAKVEVTAGESVLSISGTADLALPEREVAVTLNQLSLHRGKEELYALQQPCAIRFQAGKTNEPAKPWTLVVDAFDLRSERLTLAGSANLHWPSRGAATLAMTNVTLADVSDFVEADLPNISVGELAATAHWSNGPVHAAISAAATMTNAAGRAFALRGTVDSGELLKLDLLARASGYAPMLSVTGTVPVKVFLDRGEGLVLWDKSQSIALAGNFKDSQPEAFTIPLGTWGQLDVLRPELDFKVSGTPAEPVAALTAGAAKLTWQSKTNKTPRPKLEDLKLAVEIRPDLIRLKTFAMKLDGQPIMATGAWALPAQTWQVLWSSGKLPDWNQAEGHLELQEAQVAALSAYLPEVLAPEGRLTATLDLKTGKRLEGVLSVTNAATRPLGPITPLRDVTALVRFDGQRAVLEDFRGQIGGQPIRADGFVTIPEVAGDGLDYRVNLRGTNVPLARSPELLLRGDLAVSFRGGSNQPPQLSGAVTLRDGLYVQHASALVWSAPERPEWRPPYFSVTNAPFADWKLDLAVRGDRFLRLRSPVFSGIASTDFQLRGTLLAPVLTGDARMNSGHLIFPFGSLVIDQGLASFSGNDVRGPNLKFNASGRNYRYDLRLEVKGPADGANVIFSSTPPLASEQILLMLTAGEIPQSEFAFSTSARAGQLATFMGKDLLSRYLGTDPAKERLIIQSGESISTAGRLTYSVEYRLTDRWSIIGEYDEFNAFNTDLKWKVFTR